MSELRPILFSFVRKKKVDKGGIKFGQVQGQMKTGISLFVFLFDRQIDRHVPLLTNMQTHWLLLKLQVCCLKWTTTCKPPLPKTSFQFWSKSKIFQYSSSLNADPLIAVKNAGLLIKMNNSLSATLAQVIPWIFVKAKDFSKFKCFACRPTDCCLKSAFTLQHSPIPAKTAGPIN